jgi:hypothetical protein
MYLKNNQMYDMQHSQLHSYIQSHSQRWVKDYSTSDSSISR